MTVENLCRDKHVSVRNNRAKIYLESSDPVHHSFQLDALDVLILPVDPLYPEDVVAEVQTLEPPLLGQEHDHHAAGPVEALAKQLLHRELVLSNYKENLFDSQIKTAINKSFSKKE